MPSSLFQNPASKMSCLMNLLRGNPSGALQIMMETNPQFRQFYEANKNKPIEQIARENGVNMDDVQSIMRTIGL